MSWMVGLIMPMILTSEKEPPNLSSTPSDFVPFTRLRPDGERTTTDYLTRELARRKAEIRQMQ